MVKALSVCVVVVTILAACAAGSPDLAAFQREPAAGLRMADATELGHFFGTGTGSSRVARLIHIPSNDSWTLGDIARRCFSRSTPRKDAAARSEGIQRLRVKLPFSRSGDPPQMD